VSDLKLCDNKHSVGNRLGAGLAGLVFKVIGQGSAIKKNQRKIETSITLNDIITRHSEVLEKIWIIHKLQYYKSGIYRLKRAIPYWRD